MQFEQHNDFMGLDGFLWFIGVVEDRNDPERAGRVRVRCVGHHTEDKSLLPTEELPWAQVLAPTDTPSMQGMGHTPPFLVEGTHVLGFFVDPAFAQQPFVLGSIGGKPVEESNPIKGFYDPNGRYPKTTNEPDVNRLARGSIAETAMSLKKRRGMRQTKVPTAIKTNLSTIAVDAKLETRQTWDELPAKSDSVSIYPYNHVHESEAGHVHEIDDSVGGERLLKQHVSGTFEEIHPKGDKVVKVVGDNYELVVGSSFILIEGDVNITYGTDKRKTTVRELIKGDYILEVEGDMFTTVHGNHKTKIGAARGGSGGGNKEEEINGNYGFNINQKVKGRIGDNSDVTVIGNDTRIVNGNHWLEVRKNVTMLSLTDDIQIAAQKNFNVGTATGIVGIKSGSRLNIKSVSSMTINPETSLALTVGTSWVSTTGTTWDHTSSSSVDIDGSTIDLN